MRKDKLYKLLASSVDAYLRCIETNNKEWEGKHKETIETLVDFMPSGSGIDNATKIDLGASTGEKLVFTFGYHHMDENGYYRCWTYHTLIVKSSLIHGFVLTISGPNRNEIKDYLHEVYDCALSEELEWDDEKKCYFSPSLRQVKEGIIT